MKSIVSSIDSEKLRRDVLYHVCSGQFIGDNRKMWLDVIARQLAISHGITWPNWELRQIVKNMAKAADALCKPPKVRQVGPCKRSRPSSR